MGVVYNARRHPLGQEPQPGFTAYFWMDTHLMPYLAVLQAPERVPPPLSNAVSGFKHLLSSDDFNISFESLLYEMYFAFIISLNP